MNKYTLIWSPEGRVIAEVEARTAKSAKRQAPLPYRRYPGEIRVEPTNPNAFIAVVRLVSDGWLLGGTRQHVSSPFASEQMARAFAQQSIEVNRGRPGYERADIRFEIIGTYADASAVVR